MKEKYLYVTTVEELAELISQYLNHDKILTSTIPAIDFCTVDVERKPLYSDAEIRQLRQRAEGWYGIAKVEFPFNSSTLFLMADYYGGGAEELIRLYDGIGKDEAVDEILDHILDCLQANEGNGRIQTVHWKTVYTGSLEKGIPANNIHQMLEAIYTHMNVKTPEEYSGRSMSVSDIVAVNEHGNVKFWYCDNIGFTKI